ncbi:hypothetical protein PGTUg99_023047 [Puccinia graminis f. sp. tritici]|uniref:Uncharacterized protein n=2 Tax=Puccinia graminis f. sp. tritici TaxID=56615 RepID=E3KBD6_PUCGT|nr:uncharacterized protein PGTG_07898 [Puccinia graminis f. sp. tritici CRL 75-36-700-3]EFP81649.2 hypothetical protein PGTG_07898 [Puccinia graminis f. sp. tritici CRL 75-36-700-3]KAA1100564.1 hypothetical protein PGTUg99_023047 [Puccinia graminis f. sp. tritici]
MTATNVLGYCEPNRHQNMLRADESFKAGDKKALDRSTSHEDLQAYTVDVPSA